MINLFFQPFPGDVKSNTGSETRAMEFFQSKQFPFLILKNASLTLMCITAKFISGISLKMLKMCFHKQSCVRKKALLSLSA